jgi:hypothetical protein
MSHEKCRPFAASRTGAVATTTALALAELGGLSPVAIANSSILEPSDCTLVALDLIVHTCFIAVKQSQ